jgi:putative membrane protein
VSLVATTAAGQQSYEILDVPEAVAVALADVAVPGLLTDFVELGVSPL